MVKLIRTRPLAGQAADHAAPTDDSQVVVAEMPYRALTNVRVGVKAAKKLKTALSIDLPAAANTISENKAGLRCLWLGPDEWLIQDLKGDGDAQADAIAEALEGVHHSVKNVSSNFTTICVSGPRARDILSKVTPLDVHASVFTLGQCAQTVMAKSSVILDVVSDGDEGATFDITLRRSFAAYVWGRLIDAGLEYHVGVLGAEEG